MDSKVDHLLSSSRGDELAGVIACIRAVNILYDQHPLPSVRVWHTEAVIIRQHFIV